FVLCLHPHDGRRHRLRISQVSYGQRGKPDRRLSAHPTSARCPGDRLCCLIHRGLWLRGLVYGVGQAPRLCPICRIPHPHRIGGLGVGKRHDLVGHHSSPLSCDPERSEAESRDLGFGLGLAVLAWAKGMISLVITHHPLSCHLERSEAESRDLGFGLELAVLAWAKGMI